MHTMSYGDTEAIIGLYFPHVSYIFSHFLLKAFLRQVLEFI